MCGEGRLLALKALGQTEAPVCIVSASKEDLLLTGLAENIARRPHTTMELAREISAMKERGQKPADIARKVDLDVTYVNAILRLLKRGEERLIQAVERRQLPLSVAVSIAESTDQEVQRAMTEAYEAGQLRGRALLKARRLLEQRKLYGKSGRGPSRKDVGVSAATLVKAYKKEASRQQVELNRARLCETRLRFVVSAMKKLLADEGFVHLLRAEGLGSLPQPLIEDKVYGGSHAA